MALVETVRKPAPAHVPGQYFLFLRGGEAVLGLQLFQQPNGFDIAIELLSGGAHAQGIVMNTVVMALLHGDFRVQDSRGHFAVPAYCRGRGKLDGGGLFRLRGGLRFRLLRVGLRLCLFCGFQCGRIGGEQMAV